MSNPKPYDPSKRRLLEAYRRVKANQGAAGIDGISLSMFEADLAGNLYKLWNRMSSGSYFPSPVKQVQIPKKDGGVRILGVPTVSNQFRGSWGFPQPFIVSTTGIECVRSKDSARIRLLSCKPSWPIAL